MLVKTNIRLSQLPQSSSRTTLKELDLLFDSDSDDAFDLLVERVTPFTGIEMLKLIWDGEKFPEAVKLAELANANSSRFSQLELNLTDRMRDFCLIQLILNSRLNQYAKLVKVTCDFYGITKEELLTFLESADVSNNSTYVLSETKLIKQKHRTYDAFEAVFKTRIKEANKLQILVDGITEKSERERL